MAGLDPSDVANLSFLWHKGPDFDKGGVKVPLVFRTATVEDVKPKNGQGGAKHSSRFLWTMSVREVRRLFFAIWLTEHTAIRSQPFCSG